MQLPIELQRLVASTIKLTALTAGVAAICWLAYGPVPAIRIFLGVTGVIVLGQIWAYRADIATYLSSLFNR